MEVQTEPEVNWSKTKKPPVNTIVQTDATSLISTDELIQKACAILLSDALHRGVSKVEREMKDVEVDGVNIGTWRIIVGQFGAETMSEAEQLMAREGL